MLLFILPQTVKSKMWQIQSQDGKVKADAQGPAVSGHMIGTPTRFQV
jgi:hypothetical protein